MSLMSHAGVVSQAAHNARMYFDHAIAQVFSREPIQFPELMIVVTYASDFIGKRVLDLGVGAGRTTRVLLPFCADYVGIDISPIMLNVSRRAFPRARLLEMDIRQVASLGPNKFDFVLGPYCILDAVSHPERVTLLQDLHTIITAGGLLVFSSHNRRYREAGKGPRLERSRNPVTQLRLVFDYAVARVNHHRTRRHQIFEADYAVINDCGCRWLGLHYYIDRTTQEKQLRHAGFQLLGVYGDEGGPLGPGDDDSSTAMLYYVCRRDEM